MKVEELKKDELLELKGKYIFHGSITLFDEAKPHQARCSTKNPENEQFAVYGSPDLEFAILFAFPKLPEKEYNWSADHTDNGYVGVLHNKTYIDDNAYGYVYCFDKSKFKPTREGSSQFVCEENIVPEMVVKVWYKDFKELFVKEHSNINAI